MITDEMVEKAWKGWFTSPDDGTSSTCMRAALEAVAPMLIAQGMREAAAMFDNRVILGDEARRVLARAQELDPK